MHTAPPNAEAETSPQLTFTTMLLQHITQLRQKRSKALADARSINERAIKDSNRVLNTEERSQWDKLIKEVNDLKDEIDRCERQHQLEKELDEVTTRDLSENPTGNNRGGDIVTSATQGDVELAKRQQAAFGKFLRSGLTVLNDVEKRDLSVGSGPDGGFTLAPQQWVNQLIKFIDDQTFIRAKATKHTLTQSESLGMPSLDTDVADSDWTSELATGSNDSSMKFGRRELKPSPLAKRIKVSNRLIQRSAQPIESLVMQRLGYKFAVTEEKAFLTGNGVGKPLGLFVASNDGIPTGRDVSSGGTSLSATAGANSQAGADAMINMKFSLKAQYWARAEWLFHRDIVSIIAKFKDANGQYMFRESLRSGESDTLLGRPINMSEFAPNTNTTGQYIGLLGDFSFYHICDALSMQMQRLTELYAETNQTGYIGRAEVDGMPVLSEAFARLKNA
jgi:HK97 family phage major capsid protein